MTRTIIAPTRMLSDQLLLDERPVEASLNLPYRKNRHYIHSADIFQALTNLARDRFSPDAYLESLVLRRQAVRQIGISFQVNTDAIGTFSVRAGEAQMRGWLVETDGKVVCRVPYDESRAADAVITGAESAWFTAPVPGYTTFEQLLVLLKAAGGEAGKRDAWLCQVSLRGPLLQTKPLTVNFLKRILHRFFSFEIMQDERVIGTACASLRS